MTDGLSTLLLIIIIVFSSPPEMPLFLNEFSTEETADELYEEVQFGLYGRVLESFQVVADLSTVY